MPRFAPHAPDLFRGGKGDPKTVFVAGASGVTGTRLVLELLAAGFTVRAGVDESQSAQRLGQLASEYRVSGCCKRCTSCWHGAGQNRWQEWTNCSLYSHLASWPMSVGSWRLQGLCHSSMSHKQERLYGT